MNQPREAEAHRLIAGVLCLDFANTINGHRRAQPHEYLHDFRDLVTWGRHAGILSQGETRLLLRAGADDASKASQAFQRALTLRECIYRVFDAVASRKTPRQDDLEQIAVAWREAQQHARLSTVQDGFALRWDDEPSLNRISRAVSVSAIVLLTSVQSKRIRACSGESCDWLFVDESRNHLRRWCSMDECGNRAKMKRRAERGRLARAG